ncbi:DUF2512 family protein [Paenibacillus sp. R14(2021)]|uniref:DUF2512 family protein n=1 Tax=Paenibacillus sp. R14(2021) TaxID=2859228 RepID=UPI001C61357D|nr:DUF2512 family protein [Paenibacillus sp. R14(2021)]
MKFILKWLVNGVIVVSLLMYYADVSFWNAAITATALTLIAYFVGDQLILRSTNNMVATLADFVLAYLILWFAADQMDWDLNGGEILVIAVILGIAEWFIHRYVFQEELSVRAK